MVLIRAVVVERGPTPGVMVREANRLMAAAWEGTGFYWGEKIRQRHFWSNAGAMYKYKPRTKKYEARKRKQKGHARPLVYSGETEKLTEDYRVRANSNGARVSMRAFALNLSGRGEELRAVNDPEAKELARVCKDDYDKALWKYRGGFKSTEIK